MDKKYCAYICAGCGIGDALDMEALAEVVSGEMSMECKTHDCLCGAEGRALIESDIAGGVNTVVVGACSPRVMARESLISGRIRLPFAPTFASRLYGLR